MAPEPATAAEVHLADQRRTAIRNSLGVPCTCDTCPTDQELRALVELPDIELARLDWPPRRGA